MRPKILLQSPMNGRAVRERIIDQERWSKITQQSLRASDMERVAMTKQKSIHTICSCRVQKWTKHPFVIARASAIKKPIGIQGAQMDSRACADVEHRDRRA